MKRLFVVLCLFILANGCSIDSAEDVPAYQTIAMPVSEVDVPEHFVFGQTYTISMSYRVPSNCYSFSDVIIEAAANERTITILNLELLDAFCESYSDVSAEASFNLEINSNQNYILRFWKGKNTNGQDDYYVVEVPVRR